MESRGRRRGGNVGEGGWDRLHKQVALLLQVCCAESSWEGFLTRSEQPESTFFLFHSTLSVLFMKKTGNVQLQTRYL